MTYAPPADWGLGRLTAGELGELAMRMSWAREMSVRQANRSGSRYEMRTRFALAAEMCRLWGEATDELIVRGPESADKAPEVTAAREPEDGS